MGVHIKGGQVTEDLVAPLVHLLLRKNKIVIQRRAKGDAVHPGVYKSNTGYLIIRLDQSTSGET